MSARTNDDVYVNAKKHMSQTLNRRCKRHQHDAQLSYTGCHGAVFLPLIAVEIAGIWES